MSDSETMLPPADEIADRAIASMRSPRDMHIICVDVTNRCDLRCSNCTRLLVNQDHHWDMSPDNFRTALRSLRGFTGVIAMIGGNPCLNKHFPELCRIFVDEVPNKRQRGLWSNNVFKFQELIRDTFGFFNLNPHNDAKCIESLKKLRDYIPGISFYEGNSRHSPLLTAVRDVIPDPRSMWDAIAGCDINKNWSASIVENNGELRAYFCEVAASFDLARNGDHGVPVTEGWWRRSIVDYADQVKRFCPGCGVPARLAGHLDSDETDDYSETNADIACAARGKRKTVAVNAPEQVARTNRPVTDYTEQHVSIDPTPNTGLVVSVVIPCYNGADTIVETIESVLAQRKAGVVAVDIVVADDASTDESARKVAALARQHPNTIRFLPTSINAGPAAARNRGLRAARGSLVCFLDADDCYNPGFFELAVRAFTADPTIAAIFTAVQLVDNHREVHPLQLQALTQSIPSNVIVKRAVAELVGGFPEDPVFRGPTAGEDVVFRRMLESNFNVKFLDRPLLRYRVRRGSHFDLFIDTTQVVNGALRSSGVRPEDTDGTRPAASAAHRRRLDERFTAIQTSMPPQPIEPRGMAMVEEYEAIRQKIGNLPGIAPAEGYLLHRCAAMAPGRGYVGAPARLNPSLKAWLDEGSRRSARLPTAALDQILQAGPDISMRMLVLEVPPLDQHWLAELHAGLPRLHPAGYVAFCVGGDTTQVPAMAAALKTAGSWVEAGRTGGVIVYRRN